MIRAIYTLFLVLQMYALNSSQDPKSCSPEKALMHVVEEVSEKLEQDYGLRFRVIGEVGSETILEQLTLGYEGNYSIGEDVAREMLVHCVFDVLRIINDNEVLRPMLSNYPFEPKNLNFTLMFYKNNYKRNLEPHVMCVSVDYGKVYLSYYSDNESYSYSRENQETFDEALAKVRQQRQDGSAS